MHQDHKLIHPLTLTALSGNLIHPDPTVDEQVHIDRGNMGRTIKLKSTGLVATAWLLYE